MSPTNDTETTTDREDEQDNRNQNDDISPEAMEKLVQFVHPEKVYGYLPGTDEELIAALYGLDVATHREMKQRFTTYTREAAQELLADRTFEQRVNHLPFRPGETMVGIGESSTDDLQSWLEILRTLLNREQPDDRIHVINEGTSGRTTTDALRAFPQIAKQQPDWIICFLGGNDAARYGQQPTKTSVSLEETAKNFAELRHLAETQTTARWVWITMYPMDEERVASSPSLQQSQLTVHNEHVTAINDIIRGQSTQPSVQPVRESDPVVDLEPVFGNPPASELLLPDGHHPSLAGHRAITEAFVECLTTQPDMEEADTDD